MTATINACPACGTSLNCSGCGEDIQNIVEQSALLKEKDAEIVRLQTGFIRIIWEVKAGATDTEVNAICREMLGFQEET